MTIATIDILLYSGALLVLFLTPGPVWVAITARTLTGGFHSAWPLALGVAAGDIIWPFLAILGVSWIVGIYAGFMAALQVVAVVFFVVMGVLLIRYPNKTMSADSRLSQPGTWAGFVAGLAVILSNPKAILFYMGVLPGFFDLTALTTLDIAVICIASFFVPLLGNLALAVFVDRARALLSSPEAVRRTNVFSGWMLIAVGVVIALG